MNSRRSSTRRKKAAEEDPLQMALGALVAQAFAGKLDPPPESLNVGVQPDELAPQIEANETEDFGNEAREGGVLEGSSLPAGVSAPDGEAVKAVLAEVVPPLGSVVSQPSSLDVILDGDGEEAAALNSGGLSADSVFGVCPPPSHLSSPSPMPTIEGAPEVREGGAVVPVCVPPPQVPSPEPIAARMLNEYVYCPRLFYYEQVEGVFVDNADTLRGSANHLRVDRGKSGLPKAGDGTRESLEGRGGDAESGTAAAEEKAETIHSHAVSLGSERLGVTAKLDLVESRWEMRDELPGLGGAETEEEDFLALRVMPVEYKNGSPRDGEEGNEIWPADRMQLGVQMLLLRENGYRCEQGILYYRGSRQRIALEYSPELEAWVLEQVAGARRAMEGRIPEPLVDSPKCPRCSLVTVCLPDETRWMANGEVESLELRVESKAGAQTQRLLTLNPQLSTSPPPKLRALAPRDERRVLYLNTPGLHLGRAQEVLQVRDKKTLVQEVRLSDVSHAALFGNIQISTQAIQALCEQDVPVSYFSMGGWFYGITRGHALTNVMLRIEQFRLAQDAAFCLRLAREFIRGKIRNHRTLLMRNHLQPPEAAIQRLKVAQADLDRAGSLGELLGMEGAAAAVYFKHFAGLIKASEEAEEMGPSAAMAAGGRRFSFDFEGRHRRPPTDPVNALLSLAYSLLAKDCTIAALAVGLDPYVGFYHQPRHGRPALALDLMEEFRPLIAESAVITAINNRMVTPKDFVSAGRSVNLSQVGRRHFFEAYENRMNDTIEHPIFKYKVTYRRALELQFRILARALTGEIASYLPFVTR